MADENGKNIILTTVSSLSPEYKKLISDKKTVGNREQAKLIGELLAQKALTLSIKKAVFDRSGYSYTGRIKMLAESARKGGLEF